MATPTDPIDTPTALPCAMQYSWTLLLDEEGNPITQQNSDEVDGLWQDADGDQMWAPSTYFCPASADTPTPTLEATDTETPTSTPVVVLVRETARPAPPAPAPVPARPAPAPAPEVVERVVVATPTDAVAVEDTPEPTKSPTSTSTPTSSPTSTPAGTPQATATATPGPTSTPLVVAATDNANHRGGLTLEVPPWLDPIGRIVSLLLVVLLVLMFQAPVRRSWRALRQGAGNTPSSGMPDDNDIGLIGGGSL